MKFMYKAAAFAVAGASFVSAVSAAAAPEATSRIWLAGGLKKAQPTLAYSTPESDDIGVILSCKGGGGTVKVFLSETSDKFKPGQTATVAWSVGSTKSSFSATFKPNEEAGVPSAEGSTPLNDPVLGQLKDAGKLTFSIDQWSESFPLKGIGEQAAKFVAACSK